MNPDIKVEEFKEDEGAQSNPTNLIVEDDEEEVLLLGDDDLDQDIVDSIANMGFNRSQVVSQIIGATTNVGETHGNSQIG